ncbi:Caffeic acid 3-O-methyltransferase [Ancistrocladus abbreviatus]
MASTPEIEHISNCTREEDEESSGLWSFAMTLISGSVHAMVLKTVVELDVFEIIKRAGPGAHLSSAEIAAQLPANSNPDITIVLDRLLRLLASYSVLTCTLRSPPGGGSVERLYGLAPVCKYLTKNEDGVSLAPFHLLLQDKDVMQAWSCLKDQVLEGGIAFNKAYGMPLLEFLGVDARHQQLVKDTMSNHSTLITKKLLETYKGFEGVSTLVDVGGGTGATLNMILSKYPSIRGINYDLSYVIREAPPYPGVEHVAGDFFVSIPEGDAMFMKYTFHTFGDEQCLRILKNCYAALPDYGKVIICEHVLPVVPETSDYAKTVFVVDTLMLAHNQGKERTEEEFKALGKEAGFRGFQVACSAYDMKIIELFKTDY